MLHHSPRYQTNRQQTKRRAATQYGRWRRPVQGTGNTKPIHKNLTTSRAATDSRQQYINCLCCSLSISTGWAWFPDSINHSVLQTSNLHILKHTHTRNVLELGMTDLCALRKHLIQTSFKRQLLIYTITRIPQESCNLALQGSGLGDRRCGQLFLLSR